MDIAYQTVDDCTFVEDGRERFRLRFGKSTYRPPSITIDYECEFQSASVTFSAKACHIKGDTHPFKRLLQYLEDNAPKFLSPDLVKYAQEALRKVFEQKPAEATEAIAPSSNWPVGGENA